MGVSSKSRMAAGGSRGERARLCLAGCFGEKSRNKEENKRRPCCER